MSKRMEFQKFAVGEHLNYPATIRAVETYMRALGIAGQHATDDHDDDLHRLASVMLSLEDVLRRGELGEDEDDHDLLGHALAELLALVERRERRKAEATRYACRARGLDADSQPVFLSLKHRQRPRALE